MFCDFAFYVGGTRENIDDIPALERLPGSAGIKVFMGSSTGDLLVDDDASLDRIIAAFGRRAAFHAEDEARLNARMGVRRRRRSGLASRVARRGGGAARDAAPRAPRREARRRVHVLHVSTAAEMAVPRRPQGLGQRRGDAASPDAGGARLLRAARHLRADEPAGARRAASRCDLGGAAQRRRRRARLRPRAAYARGEGSRLSRPRTPA